jgi:hypothetical protein
MISSAGITQDDINYPTLFDIVPGSKVSMADDTIALFKEYNWTKVVIINEIADVYLKVLIIIVK